MLMVLSHFEAGSELEEMSRAWTPKVCRNNGLWGLLEACGTSEDAPQRKEQENAFLTGKAPTCPGRADEPHPASATAGSGSAQPVAGGQKLWQRSSTQHVRHIHIYIYMYICTHSNAQIDTDICTYFDTCVHIRIMLCYGFSPRRYMNISMNKDAGVRISTEHVHVLIYLAHVSLVWRLLSLKL